MGTVPVGHGKWLKTLQMYLFINIVVALVVIYGHYLKGLVYRLG